MASKIGMSVFPTSVREYSTFGGICGYSTRFTSPSSSSSLRLALRVLYDIPLMYPFISLNLTVSNSMRQ